MVRRHKENFLLSKQNNSQNFCFQPIIFEHFSVSMGVENILRLKNILKFMASGHACLSVEQKERYISHHAFCRYIFKIYVQGSVHLLVESSYRVNHGIPVFI
jgi:hypothetical protein